MKIDFRCVHSTYQRLGNTQLSKGVLQDVVEYTTKAQPQNMIKEIVTHYEHGDFIKRIFHDVTNIPQRIVHIATDKSKTIFERASKHGYLVEDLAQQNLVKNNEKLTLISDEVFHRLST